LRRRVPGRLAGNERRRPMWDAFRIAVRRCERGDQLAGGASAGAAGGVVLEV
ncbi:MAG: hypothetical protein QOF65_1905, partial [Thermoleophilaceae bacterium]|nr:hypothetical protein [Thermoleophilaceae bacterium]